MYYEHGEKIRKICKSNPLNTLITLDNPELSSLNIGLNFTRWQGAGIKRIHGLFENRRFKTFDSMKTQYQLSNKSSIVIYKLDIMCIRKPTLWIL